MDNNEKNVRIAGKVLIKQSEELQRGIAIVNSQGTTDPNYARSFSGCGRNLGSHRAFENRDVLAAVPLFCQGDCLLWGKIRSLGRSTFRLLCRKWESGPKVPNEEQ